MLGAQEKGGKVTLGRLFTKTSKKLLFLVHCCFERGTS